MYFSNSFSNLSREERLIEIEQRSKSNTKKESEQKVVEEESKEVEAMLSGTPVVVSDIGGLNEIVDHFILSRLWLYKVWVLLIVFN